MIIDADATAPEPVEDVVEGVDDLTLDASMLSVAERNSDNAIMMMSTNHERKQVKIASNWVLQSGNFDYHALTGISADQLRQLFEKGFADDWAAFKNKMVDDYIQIFEAGSVTLHMKVGYQMGNVAVNAASMKNKVCFILLLYC